MADHVSISAEEAGETLAIRELVDAYARCADRCDADGQKALFLCGHSRAPAAGSVVPSRRVELGNRAAGAQHEDRVTLPLRTHRLRRPDQRR